MICECGLALYFLIASIIRRRQNQSVLNCYVTIFIRWKYSPAFFQLIIPLSLRFKITVTLSAGCPLRNPPPPYLHLAMVILGVFTRGLLRPLDNFVLFTSATSLQTRGASKAYFLGCPIHSYFGTGSVMRKVSEFSEGVRLKGDYYAWFSCFTEKGFSKFLICSQTCTAF